MIINVCFGILGLGMATLVFAEQAGSTQERKVTGAASASKSIGIVGKQVSNNAGDNLGVVDNVLIDPASGQVTALVIGIGGVLGYGAYNYEVPWRRVKFAQDHTQIVVNVPRDKLNSEFPAYKKPQPHPNQKPPAEEHTPNGSGGKSGP
jgi:sporulation protein YlmC with PRC-barrel domain